MTAETRALVERDLTTHVYAGALDRAIELLGMAWDRQCGKTAEQSLPDAVYNACLSAARAKGFQDALLAQNAALRAQLAAAEQDVRRMRAGIDAVQALIGDSRGVVGLHLNGDEASWDELRTGGRFEEWLADFDAALPAAGDRGECGLCGKVPCACGKPASPPPETPDAPPSEACEGLPPSDPRHRWAAEGGGVSETLTERHVLNWLQRENGTTVKELVRLIPNEHTRLMICAALGKLRKRGLVVRRMVVVDGVHRRGGLRREPQWFATPTGAPSRE